MSGGHAPAMLDGRYTLVAPMGQGAMGDVWRAHDAVLDRDVALKQLRPGADIEQLASEARMLGRLDHPNVATVYDFQPPTQAAGGFMTMELILGTSLDGLLAEGSLPPTKVAMIGTDVADGLSAMHARGIMHRDVKPANIMVTPGGTAVLVDLGVAGRPEEGGANMGTTAYAAPERLAGAPGDAAADIYSLGLVLAACLAPDEPPLAVAKSAAPPYDDLLARMLAPHPDHRPSAGEVAGVLARAREDTATRELGTRILLEESPERRTTPPWGKILAATVATVLLGIAVIAAIAAITPSPVADPPVTAPIPQDVTVPEVTGLTVAAASMRLADRDLVVGAVTGTGTIVVRSDPARGAGAVEGDAVDLHLGPLPSDEGPIAREPAVTTADPAEQDASGKKDEREKNEREKNEREKNEREKNEREKNGDGGPPPWANSGNGGPG